MDVLGQLADTVTQLGQVHDRVLIGIDGPDAAGKTTMADALAGRLDTAVIRASADDFQFPRAARYQRGDRSAEGYYRDAFDHASVVSLLLAPFRDGAASVITARYDYHRDVPLDPVPTSVEPRAVLVVDGVFLQRETLRGFWSRAIYLTVSPEVSLRRGVVRDRDRFATIAEAELRYRERYLAGQVLYREDVDPQARADIVIDNSDPRSPVLL